MTKKEQRKIIKDLIKNCKDDLLKNVSNIPCYWDGVELRWWISNKFQKQEAPQKNYPKRLKEYKNLILVKNL